MGRKRHQISQNRQYAAERFFELSIDMLAVASTKDGYYKKVNPAFCRTLGWSESELLSKPFYHFAHPEELEGVRKAVDELRLGRDLVQFEQRMRCKDGGYKWIAWNTAPYPKEDLLYCVGRDITKHRETENALAARHEMLQGIIENIPVMLVIWDPKLQNFKLNAHTTTVLGWTDAEANHRDFMSKVYPDADYRQKVSDFMLSLSLEWRELHPTTASGEQVPSAWTNIKLSDNTMIGIGIDIRERKKIEEVLERDNETLEKLVTLKSKELLDARQKLEEAKRLSDIGVLAATVAHELRNPLSAISLSVYNLQKKIKDKELFRKINNINIKIAESEMIIENLLFYSKLRPPQRGKINPYAVVKDSLSEFKEGTFRSIKINENGVDSIDGCMMEADVHQVKEVIVNLLNNASDALGKDAGTIELHTQIHDNTFILRIRDNGQGIERAQLGKIYDPFFTTKARGTGLGLTVCRQIIEMHKGSLEIESEKGIGTTVTVRLPV